jgi:tRNA nucleotidyltransferase (CCA-adding enzyme)
VWYSLAMDDREAVEMIARMVRAEGGRALVVGGAARDRFTGAPIDDLDVECFEVPVDTLEDLLSDHFDVDCVGRSFGILKIRGFQIDVSIPRRESQSVVPGVRSHRAFTIEGDPTMTPLEAARRRDFTINTISIDPLTDEVIDPFGGLADLRAGILRHTSEQFAEDPLRVLRGAQFIARFGLVAAPETMALCASLDPSDLSSERIFGELEKLLLRGVRPGAGIAFLHEVGWLERVLPELAALSGVPQERDWHPEGCCLTHTQHCLDAFAQDRVGDRDEDLVVGLAVMCHDLGKATHTEFKDGRWKAHGHEQAGEDPTRAMLVRVTDQTALIDQVVPLVTNHLKPVEFFRSQVGMPAIRRLAQRVGRIDRLVRVSLADQRGRPPIEVPIFEAGDWLIARAAEVRVVDCRPQGLVMGRHVLELGVAPGPVVGRILAECFEAQLDGVFDDLDGGIEFARQLLAA